MATTVGAFEAKTHLSALLDRVERGEEIVITRRGRAVARLVAPVGNAPDRDAVLASLRELRQRISSQAKPFTLEEILALRDEGRKY